MTYENLLLSCLRTGDEKAAHECLKRLVQRFGDDNERIMAFGGLVKEAEASNNAELEKVLRDYDAILAENDTNIVSIAVLSCTMLATNRKTAHYQKKNSFVAVVGSNF